VEKPFFPDRKILEQVLNIPHHMQRSKFGTDRLKFIKYFLFSESQIHENR